MMNASVISTKATYRAIRFGSAISFQPASSTIGTRNVPSRIMTRPTPETPSAQFTPNCGIQEYFSVSWTSDPLEVSKAVSSMTTDSAKVTSEVTRAMPLAAPLFSLGSAQTKSAPTTGTTTRMESQGRFSNIDVIPLPRVPQTRVASTTATMNTTPASMVAA